MKGNIMHKLILIVLLFNVVISYSQNVREIPKPEDTGFIDSLFTELRSKRDSGLYTAIDILENGLKNVDNDFEIYKITSNLGALYTLTNQYDKCINIWLSANKQGICYDFQINKNTYPPYLSAYKDNQIFYDFIRKNDSLRNVISINSKAEYFVNLPIEYDKSKKYPLVIILHGGVSNFYNTFENWKSEDLQTKYITVYPQGREVRGSFERSYGNYGIQDVLEVHNQVLNKYSIDTASVILSGQSAGGALSIELLNGQMQAKGLLLAFPVKPEDFDIIDARNMSDSSIRVYMICGEQDKHFYPGQLELSLLLDSANVENRVIKYPNLGHDFPVDFKSQIDLGIKFILNE